MEQVQQRNCQVCESASQHILQLECKHGFCQNCLRQYIITLKKYHLFAPEKLICLAENCKQELSDQTISILFPGEQGFKRYKQSKDLSMQIFHCRGFLRQDRKNIIEKLPSMTRQEHSKLINDKIRQQQTIKERHKHKICTNILSFNKFNIKQKVVQCYVCGASYCPKCLDLSHQGNCKLNALKQNQQMLKYMKNKKPEQSTKNSQEAFDTFLKANKMVKCLNPKCGVPIAKQEGCFWVKCRCSWEFCYPCQKIWGDCEHFAKYPYKKFVPPPQWMIKALNLY